MFDGSLSSSSSSSKVTELQREARDHQRKLEQKKIAVSKEEQALAKVKQEIDESLKEEKKLGEELKKLQAVLAEKTRVRVKREADYKINTRQHLKEKADVTVLEHKLLAMKHEVEELGRQLETASVHTKRLH